LHRVGLDAAGIVEAAAVDVKGVGADAIVDVFM
jgi:hypothetical protein